MFPPLIAAIAFLERRAVRERQVNGRCWPRFSSTLPVLRTLETSTSAEAWNVCANSPWYQGIVRADVGIIALIAFCSAVRSVGLSLHTPGAVSAKIDLRVVPHVMRDLVVVELHAEARRLQPAEVALVRLRTFWPDRLKSSRCWVAENRLKFGHRHAVRHILVLRELRRRDVLDPGAS